MLDGEVINCDSLQLYKGFDVGTAKLPLDQRHGIPHHMIDVLDAGEVYSAGDYVRDARRALAEITARGRLPIVAGGTGFYLRAMLQGLPQLPSRDEALRAKLAAREAKRPGTLHRLLSRLDPATAGRIHPRDVQKLIRALEIRVLTRASLPAPSESEPLSGYATLKLALDPPREELNNILDTRTVEMFRHGLIVEVRALLASGLTGREKPFESLGYKQALACIRGAMNVEQAILSTQIETRQYAKRQWTWFRRDHGIVWLRGFGHSPSVVGHALELARAYVRD